MILLLLAAELIALYILARGLTQAIFDLTILISRSRAVGITVISILTFPGTVVHELSHLFTAEILGVHTGKLTLVPEGLDGEDIKAGSVMISESDPFRRYLIGLAPLFSGIIILTAIAYVFTLSIPVWGYWVGGYCMFAISNSMFSSKEDLSGFIPFIIVLALMIGAAYAGGIRIGLTGPVLTIVTGILDTLVKSLGIVLALNIAGFIVIKLLLLLLSKLTRRRLLR